MLSLLVVVAALTSTPGAEEAQVAPAAADAGTLPAASDAPQGAPSSGSAPKVLEGRAGSSHEEELRLLNMDAACAAKTGEVLVTTEERAYLVRCSAVDFRDVNNGFLPPEVKGYQNLEWGMSVARTRARMAGLRSADGAQIKLVRVGKFDALLALTFVNGKLKAAHLAMSKPFDAGLTQAERWDAIVAALERKYGPPHVKREGLFPEATWNNEETTLSVTRSLGMVQVIYESRRLASEVEDVAGDAL